MLNPLMWSFTSLNSYSLQLHLPPSPSTRQQPQCYRDQWPPWPAQPQAHQQAWPGRRMAAPSLPLPPSLSTHQEARLRSLWAVHLLVMLGVTHVLLPMLVDQQPVTLPLWQCQYQVSNDWFLNLQANLSAWNNYTNMLHFTFVPVLSLCFSFSHHLSGIDQMFQMEPSNTFGVLGQSAVIMCSPPNSVPPAVVQWLKDSVSITDSRFTVSSNGSLLISSVQSGDAGQYTCTATNQHLSITRTSSPAQFQVFGTCLWYIICMCFWLCCIKLRQLYCTIGQFHVTFFSVYVCFMVAMLVYCNIQYSIGEKLFHCHFGEMQAAIAIHCLHMITACPTYANNRW